MCYFTFRVRHVYTIYQYFAAVFGAEGKVYLIHQFHFHSLTELILILSCHLSWDEDVCPLLNQLKVEKSIPLTPPTCTVFIVQSIKVKVLIQSL